MAARFEPRFWVALLSTLVGAWGCQSLLELGPDGTAPVGEAGSDAAAPEAAAPEAAASGAPEFEAPTLIAAAGTASSLAMDALDVYWVQENKDSILHASRTRADGGVEQGNVLFVGVRPTGNICVGARGVYVPAASSRDGTAHAVWIISKGGRVIKEIGWGSALSPSAIFLSGTTLFATDFATDPAGGDRIGAISDDGGDPRVLSQSLPAAHLAADGSNLFFGSGTSIMRMSRGGADAGLDVVAEPVGRLAGLAVDATHVYWSDDSGSLFAAPKGGVRAQPRRLASNQAGPSSLALDTTSLYWTNALDGTVVRMTKPTGLPPGSPPPTDLPIVAIATGQATPRNLVADEQGIAWISGDGDIMTARRR